jgi:hypothetical protein
VLEDIRSRLYCAVSSDTVHEGGHHDCVFTDAVRGGGMYEREQQGVWCEQGASTA